MEMVSYIMRMEINNMKVNLKMILLMVMALFMISKEKKFMKAHLRTIYQKKEILNYINLMGICIMKVIY